MKNIPPIPRLSPSNKSLDSITESDNEIKISKLVKLIKKIIWQ